MTMTTAYPSWMRVGRIVKDKAGLRGTIIAMDLDDDLTVGMRVAFDDSSSEWYYYNFDERKHREVGIEPADSPDEVLWCKGCGSGYSEGTGEAYETEDGMHLADFTCYECLGESL